MMKKIKNFLAFKNTINNYNYSDIKEGERKRKDLLIIFFTYSFCTYLFVYTIIDLFLVYHPIAFLLLTCLIAGIINYTLFKKNIIDQNIASLVILLFSVLIFSSLFYCGGISNSGIFWIILFPPMAFFLAGLKKGIVLSFIMLFILIFIYFVLNPIPNYNINYTMIAFSVYILSLLFAFFYQYSVEQYINIATKITNDLSNSKNEIERSHQILEKTNNINNKIVAIISHDIKASIGSIRTILEQIFFKDKENENIKIALMALDATYGTLENLVDWFKIQFNKTQYRPDQISIKDLIENISNLLEPFANSKSIKILKELKSNSLIIGDVNMLEAVLRNLIFNAIKFTPYQKTIKLRTEEDDIYVKVIIEDEGPGIPDNVIEQLKIKGKIETHPGTQGEKGSGLGLFLVKEYLEKHNSSLQITNSERGASVSFKLVKA